MLLRTVRGGGKSLLISGGAGVGRSRMLDAIALEAKVLGATVLRVDGSRGHRSDFQIVKILLEQLQATKSSSSEERPCAAPEASKEADVGLGRVGESRLEIIGAVRRTLASASQRAPIVILADDLHLLDEPSMATLASLVQDVFRCSTVPRRRGA